MLTACRHKGDRRFINWAGLVFWSVGLTYEQSAARLVVPSYTRRMRILVALGKNARRLGRGKNSCFTLSSAPASLFFFSLVFTNRSLCGGERKRTVILHLAAQWYGERGGGGRDVTPPVILQNVLQDIKRALLGGSFNCYESGSSFC